MVQTPLEAAAPLIPVADFFTNPDRALPRLSPDGKYLSFLAPAGDKQNLQVFVQPLHLWRKGTDEGRKQVTHHPTHDIRAYKWTLDSSAILFLQDKDGNEDFHLFHVDLETLVERNLTPFDGVGVGRGQVNNDWFVEHKTKLNTGVIALNKQDARRHDLYHLNLTTGELSLHTTVLDTILNVLVDEDHVIRAAGGTEKDGSSTVFLPDASAENVWTKFLTSTPLDTLYAVEWTTQNKLLLLSSVDRETVALVEIDPETKVQTVLSVGEVDVNEVKSHPWSGKLQFVSYNPGRTEWTVLDESLRADFDRLTAYAKSKDADFDFIDFDNKDDQVWIVRLVYSNAPSSFILYHRNPAVTRPGAATHAENANVEFLFTSNSKVASFKLGRIASVNFKARDGLPLQAYITYPPHFQEGNKFPMVLLPHGGPWHRDVFGYSAMTQWLANRGYIVLQPNFRGSTGFNKTLLTSSFKQWGKTMHTDLLDAVEYAVSRGIVDREHVAIFGGSYGGYSALAGVTLTPEFFTCAVDIVGPSNLKTLLATVPPYWEAFLSVFHSRMGHPEHDSELLDEVSPLFHCHKIVRPLMIAQGKNDPRVKESESEQIVQAIQKNGGSVYYVMYPDEGHGFARPINRIDHFQKAELFLSKYMGDKVRTQEGLSLLDNVEGASAVVRVVGDLADK